MAETKESLYETKRIAVEPYADGFILADYSGNRGEASFCGKSMEWSRQPIVRDPFETEAAAVEAGMKA